MNISQFKNRTVLFYFSDVRELAEFESIEVCPVKAEEQLNDSVIVGAEYWTVVGKVSSESTDDTNNISQPIADLPSELYANIFANLCKEYISKKSKGDLQKGLMEVAIEAVTT